MADKTTHLGRAGEFYAMSEFLLRGWNVAVPVVDVGDDVFVIDDTNKTTYRVQVKTGDAVQKGKKYTARFTLSRMQVRAAQPIELFFMLLVRVETRWRFLLVSREELAAVRKKFEGGERKGSGRPRLSDDKATSDALAFDVTLEGDQLSAWGQAFALDCWLEALAPVVGGPGARGES